MGTAVPGAVALFLTGTSPSATPLNEAGGTGHPSWTGSSTPPPGGGGGPGDRVGGRSGTPPRRGCSPRPSARGVPWGHTGAAPTGDPWAPAAHCAVVGCPRLTDQA